MLPEEEELFLPVPPQAPFLDSEMAMRRAETTPIELVEPSTVTQRPTARSLEAAFWWDTTTVVGVNASETDWGLEVVVVATATVIEVGATAVTRPRTRWRRCKPLWRREW
ncbi:MAG: hypothetical protein M1557_03895 [Actinobacteria bacterium]|nr:hypothetical protein [Ferrimicrobium sp.]MCL5973526.1 hypothetical protein [Actinomycetota bacterium]